jgi:hypothetical protein
MPSFFVDENLVNTKLKIKDIKKTKKIRPLQTRFKGIEN